MFNQKKGGLLRAAILVVSILLFIILLCLVVLSVRSNAPEPAPASQARKRIAFVSPQTDRAVWSQAKEGFLDAAEEFGFYPVWCGSTDCRVEEMVQEIEILSAEKADAVITCPFTPSCFANAAKELQENDIPLITVNVDFEDSTLRTAFIGSDTRAIGMMQADALIEQAASPLRIGVVMTAMSAQNQLTQIEMLKSRLQEIPDAEIVSTIVDYANPITGVAAFGEMLKAHPEINAVFITSGDTVSHYSAYLTQNHLTDAVTLIGMDAIPANLSAIESGGLYGVIHQDYTTMGYLAGKYAFLAAQGQEVPDHTFTQSTLVTKENAEEFSDPGKSDEK